MSSQVLKGLCLDSDLVLRRLDQSNTEVRNGHSKLSASMLDWVLLARSYAEDFIYGNDRAIENVEIALNEYELEKSKL